MKLLFDISVLVVFLTGLIRTVQAAHKGHFNKCSTKEPTQADVFSINRAVGLYQSYVQAAADGPIVVPVCFFVIMYSDGGGDIKNKQLQAQLDTLNTGFSADSCCNSTLPCKGECSLDTNVLFYMATMSSDGSLDGGLTPKVTDAHACVVRTRNDNWASGNDLEGMKASLRKGDARFLNLFFAMFSDGTLGYAQFPWDYSEKPLTDGVIVDRNTVNGGANADYNLGATSVHEVGHWMGLLHTFQNGCVPSEGVWDTAPEAEAYYGSCNGVNPRDSCPGDGPDPIYNFMDYSKDKCLYAFTYGQRTVMQACWHYYRVGDGTENAPIPLKRGVRSTPIYLVVNETQSFLIDLQGVTSDVTCFTYAQEGDADLRLFVNDGRKPCCVSANPDTSEEECTVKLRPKGKALTNCQQSSACARTLKCGVTARKALRAEVVVTSFSSAQALTIYCY